VTPRFKFRLERVRAVRERLEDQAKEELADSLNLRLQGEAMLRAASDELAGARAARRGTGSGLAVSGRELAAAQAYLEHAQRTHESKLLNLDRCDAEVEARRAALLMAAREREVLERLKKRRATDHAREVERRQGAALDELALGVHRRREATA
jgi:flagellar FliJ protein